jgi:hypothetical protein
LWIQYLCRVKSEGVVWKKKRISFIKSGQLMEDCHVGRGTNVEKNRDKKSRGEKHFKS